MFCQNEKGRRRKAEKESREGRLWPHFSINFFHHALYIPSFTSPGELLELIGCALFRAHSVMIEEKLRRKEDAMVRYECKQDLTKCKSVNQFILLTKAISKRAPFEFVSEKLVKAFFLTALVGRRSFR